MQKLIMAVVFKEGQLEQVPASYLYLVNPSPSEFDASGLSKVEELELKIEGLTAALESSRLEPSCRLYKWVLKTRGETKHDPHPRWRNQPQLFIRFQNKLISFDDRGEKVDVLAQHFFGDHLDSERIFLEEAERNWQHRQERQALMEQLKAEKEQAQFEPAVLSASVTGTQIHDYTDLPW